MARKVELKFAEFSAWSMQANGGMYALAAALALNGLEGKWVKMCAADQRKLFGCAPFGKQSIGMFGGELKITRKVCYGTDSDTRYLNPNWKKGDFSDGLTQ